MFLWKGKQTVFFLLLLFVCAMSLIHPVWRHWYDDFSSVVHRHRDSGTSRHHSTGIIGDHFFFPTICLVAIWRSTAYLLGRSCGMNGSGASR
jgi:hypothetical protein